MPDQRARMVLWLFQPAYENYTVTFSIYSLCTASRIKQQAPWARVSQTVRLARFIEFIGHYGTSIEPTVTSSFVRARNCFAAKTPSATYTLNCLTNVPLSRLTRSYDEVRLSAKYMEEYIAAVYDILAKAWRVMKLLAHYGNQQRFMDPHVLLCIILYK
jgi:hypothetical protein